MIVHYFERCAEAMPVGRMEIHRCASDVSEMTLERWCSDSTPLAEVGLADLRLGLEETYGAKPPCLQVDFANVCCLQSARNGKS